MRRIAIVNQKGGVGKTTTTVNLGAALAMRGHRVVVVDLDPQANASLHLGVSAASEDPSTYQVLLSELRFEEAICETKTPGLYVVPSNIDLSGAELELANALGRETLLRDALEEWEEANPDPADYVLLDCPPSLGLLSINGLAAAHEVFIALQTQYFALQGMGKLVEVVALLKRRINPELLVSGIVPCLYDSRLRLAREVLAEIRKYFPGQVFSSSIATNVKLAEAPSYGQTIFEYAPDSAGSRDYMRLAVEVMEQLELAKQAQAETRPNSVFGNGSGSIVAAHQSSMSAEQAGLNAGQEFGDEAEAQAASPQEPEELEAAHSEATVHSRDVEQDQNVEQSFDENPSDDHWAAQPMDDFPPPRDLMIPYRSTAAAQNVPIIRADELPEPAPEAFGMTDKAPENASKFHEE